MSSRTATRPCGSRRRSSLRRWRCRCWRSLRTGMPRAVRTRALPPYPSPERRPSPSVVLGEAHFLTTPGPAHSPDWLTIPQRGLYTGIAILGAVGTGKTSACMYPYVDQLLRWRAQDPKRKVGGLVMEVKGDFCRQVRTMLAKAGRGDDYLEIGLNTGYCYNPLHNDLDPYAWLTPSRVSSTISSAKRQSRSGSRRTRIC
jgi:hypothetical protein